MSAKKGPFERARLRFGQAILGEHYQALVDKYRRYKNKYRAVADRLEGIELRFNLLLADLRKEEDPLIQLIHQHRRGLKTIQVDEPLVLISQIQRSGGTLLNQLFDGHPQVHAHPHELKIGGQKHLWPSLRLEDDPEVWLESLREEDTLIALREGYYRFSQESLKDVERYPFLYLPDLAGKIFHESVSQTQITSQRDILNCYFTAYFNAWLDNQNLYVGGKKYVVSFTPRLNMYPESIGGFFGDYPDGKFISIVRNPKDWYVSARKHASGKRSAQIYSSVESPIDLWMSSTSSSLSLAKDNPERVILVAFEDLLANLQPTMQTLAGFLGIKFTESLLTPTFNCFPIRANSSFKVEKYGVIDEPLRRKEELTDADRNYIERKTADLYAEALEHINTRKD